MKKNQVSTPAVSWQVAPESDVAPAPAPLAVAPASAPVPSLPLDDDDMTDTEKDLQRFRSRPTYVSRMRKAQRKSVVVDEMSFSYDVKENWATYVLLLISAMFTAMLGFYMGTAPSLLPDGSLNFNWDAGHLITAGMYVISFVGMTEFAFVVAKRKYYTREYGNDIQAGSMLAMMFFACLSILGTGIAGGIVVASTINFLTAFVAIPEWAQTWVVRVLPVLFVGYSILLTIYTLSSNKAEVARMLAGTLHERELDSRTRRTDVRQMMEEKLEAAEMGRYIEMVRDGTMTKAEAEARMRADETLAVNVRPTKGQRR